MIFIYTIGTIFILKLKGLLLFLYLKLMKVKDNKITFDDIKYNILLYLLPIFVYLIKILIFVEN